MIASHASATDPTDVVNLPWKGYYPPLDGPSPLAFDEPTRLKDATS